MKNFIIILMVLLSSYFQRLNAQIVYSENFGTGCTTGTLATTFGWTNTNTGTNQATPNLWYVSAEEQGMGVGNCGAACGGANNRTLHVGAPAVAGGDLGAAYLESSAFICSFLGWCSQTNKRIESPTINCTGVSSIPFTFEYMENGEGASDNGTVWYSANGGAAWSLLDDPPKTIICGGGQGQWTARSLTLPASADNNPNVKIGFRWVNNANGVGTDPSFAIDNIVVGTPIVLGVQMLTMNVNCNSKNQISVNWSTANEINASHFNIYKSDDGEDWRLMERVSATNVYDEVSHYSIVDKERLDQLTYYFIEQVDFDGKSTSYSTMSSEVCANNSNSLVVYPNPSNGHEINFRFADLTIEKIEIFSMDGKKLIDFYNSSEQSTFSIVPGLRAGRYFAKVMSQRQSKVVLIEIE